MSARTMTGDVTASAEWRPRLDAWARRVLGTDFASLFFPGTCPVLTPWTAFRGGRTDIEQVHLRAHRIYTARYTPLSRALATAAWPLAWLVRLRKAMPRNARFVRDRHGIGYGRQVRAMLGLALRHHMSPADYYIFRLYEPANAARAGLYMLHHESAQLMSADWWLAGAQSLNDKGAFWEHCREHGLPSPTVVATFGAGQGAAAGPEALPRADLFVKVANAYGGTGAESWRYDAARDAWSFAGRTLGADALAAHLAERGRQGPLIVQERVAAAAELAPVACHGLPTIRAVTVRSAGGEIELLAAVLKFPRGTSHVDNFSAGGLSAGIDIETGVLTRARAQWSADGEWPAHPDVPGFVIEGRRLAGWDAVRTLLPRAHETYPGLPTIGWDVALTDAGPVLIEANVGWGVKVLQIGYGAPLGETWFPARFLAIAPERAT